jgi:hypothetical protein
MAVEVPARHAGKNGRCPTCRAVLVVPTPPAKPKTSGPNSQAVPLQRAVLKDGKIRFLCACGQAISVSAEQAGRKGKCVKCHTALEVPRVSEPASSNEEPILIPISESTIATDNEDLPVLTPVEAEELAPPD